TRKRTTASRLPAKISSPARRPATGGGASARGSSGRPVVRLPSHDRDGQDRRGGRLLGGEPRAEPASLRADARQTSRGLFHLAAPPAPDESLGQGGME